MATKSGSRKKLRVKNVTERKRAEEALQASEERIRLAITVARIVIWDADLLTGKAIGFESMAELFDVMPPDDLMGALNICHPDDRVRVLEEFYKAVEKGGKYKTEWRLPTKYGDLPMLTVGEIVKDRTGRAVRAFGVILDISERKRTEETLRQSEERLRLCIGAARLGTLDWDPVHDRHVWSPEIFAIFGLPPDTVLTLDMITDMVYPGDRLDDAFATGMSPSGSGEFAMEYRIIRASDRAVRWVLQTMRVIFEGEGAARHAVRVLGVVQDITKRKNAEEELGVAKALAELYLDLMGHDINNMHQIAMGYLELVEGMIPDGDPGRELLEKSTEVLQRSARLIKNVRKLQKLKEGMFQTQDMDVCELLVDVQREFGAVPHKAITLNLNGCERCHVRANELLHDVFANLVSNAIKHTGDAADIVVDLDLVKDNGRRLCRVLVEDNGRGIPDDFKGKVFNRLQKGTDNAKGMGLGLYLVKSLVESYNGQVWVEDRVLGDHTKGARFVVLLPAVENP